MLDNALFTGLKINIAHDIGQLRFVKRADQKLYFDEWWNGRSNINFNLAPSRELYRAFIVSETITWPQYVERFTDEINNNPKAQNALKELSN